MWMGLQSETWSFIHAISTGGCGHFFFQTFDVFGDVTGKHAGAGGADLKDLVDNLVEEGAVVADQDDRAGELLNGVGEGIFGTDVEVVGGLVQNEAVSRAHEHLGQGHAVALAAGEDLTFFKDGVAAEEEGTEGSAGIGLVIAYLEGGGFHFFQDRLFRTEFFGLVLGKVADGRSISQGTSNLGNAG